MARKEHQKTSTLVKRASHLFINLANKYLREHNIAHAYTPFLLQLWKKDHQSQVDLYKHIGIEQPTAVRTLDRMERDGFIKRERSIEDRRVVIISLTSKAHNIKNIVLDCADFINKEALKSLNQKEVQQLNELLLKVIENLKDVLVLYR